MNETLSIEEQNALTRYLKRQAYNKAWRERNADKVKAFHQAYNAKRWLEEKQARERAKQLGLI